MAKQRISYVPLEQMDADMRKEMERCQREGTPRPESSAVRAHVKACFWFFANSWRDLFKNGVLDHPIKELCRLYISRSVQCDYCGNQRSVKAGRPGHDRGRRQGPAQFREVDALLRAPEGRRSRTPRRSPGTSTPTTRSGSACTGTSASPSWSSSAA
jgi:hypothetical protein